MEFSMKQVIETMKTNGLHDEAAAVGLVMEQRAELLDALKKCLAKGSRWHACDSVVIQSKQAIANAEK